MTTREASLEEKTARFAVRSGSRRGPSLSVDATRGVAAWTAVTFDLVRFGRAIEERDVGYLLSRYSQDAEVRIVDPDNALAAPQILLGRPAIQAWLLDLSARNVDPHVGHLLDGGDRVAFTEQWRYGDSTEVLAISTAELQAGLITTQHTNLVRGGCQAALPCFS